METQTPRRTLIVANLTASTPALLQEVERRATESPTTFALLIPNVDRKQSADWTPEKALQLLRRAAGAPVDSLTGHDDPFESVRQALADGQFDDVIISTLPRQRSEWLRGDLPSRVEKLGVPVMVITQPDEGSALKQFTDQLMSRPTEGAT
jgi:hypothetical protein